MKPAQFVAHRGYQAEYPENTLIGVEAALEAGASWVEVDVHLSRDGVPVVIHDPDLNRTSVLSAVVADTDWEQLRHAEVGEPQRFGTRFDGTKLSRLRDLLQMLARYPDAQAFVEIKKHCLDQRDAEQVAQLVLGDFDQLSMACPIISFSPSLLLAVREQAAVPIGLVLSDYDETHKQWLEQHRPDWVFCNFAKAKPPLWSGVWRWVMYPVNKPALARQWLDAGADLIETDDIGLLLEQATG